MDADTREYWIERDLTVVKERLPPEKCKTMPPYKRAYLFKKLRDATDRKRVFQTLGLAKDYDELTLMAGILEKSASLNRDGSVANYSVPQIANEIRLELSPIQIEFLQLSLGRKAVDAVRSRIREKFPDINLDEETPKDEQPFDEENMNPALPVVLDKSGLTKEAWAALSNSAKKQIHDTVHDGKTDIAKKLAKTALEAVPLIL
jgi:hypothetical protein